MQNAECQFGVIAAYMVQVVQFTVLQAREKHTEQTALFVCTYDCCISETSKTGPV